MGERELMLLIQRFEKKLDYLGVKVEELSLELAARKAVEQDRKERRSGRLPRWQTAAQWLAIAVAVTTSFVWHR